MEGYVRYRWIGSGDYLIPSCNQVKTAQLLRALPSEVRRSRLPSVPSNWQRLVGETVGAFAPDYLEATEHAKIS
jgi:hypothetical protein